MTKNSRLKNIAAFICLGLSFAALTAGSAAPAEAKGTAVTAVGPKGQRFTASAANNLTDGQSVTLTGSGYSTKLGIYVTYCVIPAKGQKPTECGPFDITGVNNSSFWVSSNPPLYAVPLTKPFGKGGTFKVSMKATRMIGDQDCTVVRCAFTTRADHISSDNRSADVFIPVKFKN